MDQASFRQEMRDEIRGQKDWRESLKVDCTQRLDRLAKLEARAQDAETTLVNLPCNKEGDENAITRLKEVERTVFKWKWVAVGGVAIIGAIIGIVKLVLNGIG